MAPALPVANPAPAASGTAASGTATSGTAAPELLRIFNPATGALLSEVRPCDGADVAAAMGRARRAQPAWAALGTRGRAQALRRFARRLMDDPALVDLISAESGKPRFEAEAIELFYTCEVTRFLTGGKGRRALDDERRRPFVFLHKYARVTYVPHGVVAVIGPWNWPLLNNYADCVAPLMAGNAVILKPSQVTPLTSLRVVQLWQEAGMPADVLQVLPGGGATGAALVDGADMVFFTGSEATGRSIARRCGERLIPCVLELGGKSPFVVLADADVESAARAAVWGSFANSGQVCIRPERVLVHERAADAFEAACAQQMLGLRQGSDSGQTDANIDVGAMTFGPQADHVEELIREAVALGAQVRVGGHRRTDLPGRFFSPTLLTGVTAKMRVTAEEVFGPLLPIIRFRDDDEALALANAGGRGLSGSVWSSDRRAALAFARRLETGSVCVNDVLVNYFCVEAPLGGVKGSGLGFRHGLEALRQFCRIETIVEGTPLLGRLSGYITRQLGFPYKTPVLRLLRWAMRRLY
jgi:acyl-CoA reductase-like NAD-dependent aldehyde dehydrogenase